MTLKPITLDRKPGMPPDGAEGLFLGWDDLGLVWLFWWLPVAGKWKAISHLGERYNYAFIQSHCAAPEPRYDRPEPLSVQPIPRAAG